MRVTRCICAGVVLAVFAAVGLSANQVDQPKAAQLSEGEKLVLEKVCRSIADSFIKNDVDGFRSLCIPKDLLPNVLSPKIMARGADAVHGMIVEGNTKAFSAYRARFGDLTGFSFVSAEAGYRLEKSDMYAEKTLVLKNSCFTIAHADRIAVRVKIEELVIVGDTCHLTKLD